MAEDRWDRLAADLTTAGYVPKIDEKPYTEQVNGRVRSGVSKSITFRIPGKGTITVSDTWWNRNPDIWTGWQVTAEDANDIIFRNHARTKKRGYTVELISFCHAALGVFKDAS